MYTESNSYYDFIVSRLGQKPLKIPRALPLKMVQDKKTLKAVCIYLALKPLFYNGEIYQAKKNLNSLAAYLQVSAGALRYKLKTLQDMNLITWKNDTLYLAAWGALFEYYGQDYHHRAKYHYLKDEFDVYSIELIIRRLAIEQNLKKQDNEIKEKIFNQQIKEQRQAPILKAVNQILKANIANEGKQRISEQYLAKLDQLERADFRNEKALKRKIKKSGLFDAWHRLAIANYHRNIREFDHLHDINTDVSMSCKKVAELFSLNAQSSGYYWEQRLQKARLITVQARAILLRPGSQDLTRFLFAQKTENLNLHHFIGLSGIWKKLNNAFTFSNLAYF